MQQPFWNRSATRAEAGVSSFMGYTGMWQSSNSGNLHFPLREYDPDIARWTTRDPLGMADGPNMHGYVNGNPSSYYDATGGDLIAILLGGLTAGFGAGAFEAGRQLACGEDLDFSSMGMAGVAATAITLLVTGVIVSAGAGPTMAVLSGDAAPLVGMLVKGASLGYGSYTVGPGVAAAKFLSKTLLGPIPGGLTVGWAGLCH